MTTIAHIINPVVVDKTVDLSWAQPITFESMRRAETAGVKQYAVYYQEDRDMVPETFVKLPVLTRSVLDIANFTSARRKLPLFVDMLDLLYEKSHADYFVQTNADIGLMPHFYDLVRNLINKGYRSFIINKRIIPAHYRSVFDLPEMYSELGTIHNGYDCFVFPREDYPKYKIGKVCMGTPWSETTLAASMAAFSGCKVFKNIHATFHIGDARTWLKYNDYRKHNTDEFARVLTEIAESKPDVLKNDIVQWLLFKLKHELQPHYSKECHDLCAKTTGLM